MPNTWQSLIGGDGVTNIYSFSATFSDTINGIEGATQRVEYSSLIGGQTASFSIYQGSRSFSNTGSNTNSTGSASGSSTNLSEHSRGPDVFSSFSTYSETNTAALTNTFLNITIASSASSSASVSVSGGFSAGVVVFTQTQQNASGFGATTQFSSGTDSTLSASGSSSTTFTGSFAYAGIQTATTGTAVGTQTKTLQTSTTSSATVSTISATNTATGSVADYVTTTVSATRTYTVSTTAGTSLTGVSSLTATYRVGEHYPVPVVSATGREWLFASPASFSADAPATAVASSFASTVFSQTMHTFSHTGERSIVTLTGSTAGMSNVPATRTVTGLTQVTAEVARPGDLFPATASSTITLNGRTTSTATANDPSWTTTSSTFTAAATRTFTAAVTVNFTSTSTTAARYLLTNGSTASAAVAQTFTSSSSYARQSFDGTIGSLFGSITHLGSRDYSFAGVSVSPALETEQAALAGGYRAGLSFGTADPMGSAITANRSYFFGNLLSSRAVSSPSEFHERFGASTTATAGTSVTASVNRSGDWNVTTADTATSESFVLSLGLAGEGSKFSQAAGSGGASSLSSLARGLQRHSADSTFARFSPGLYAATSLNSAGVSSTETASISAGGLTTTYGEAGIAVEPGPALARGGTFTATVAPNSTPYFASSHADL